MCDYGASATATTSAAASSSTMTALSIAAIVAAVAASAASIYAANQNTKSQNKALEKTMTHAKDAADQDYQALKDKATQIGDKAQLEKLERERQGLRERSNMLVSMGLAGVSGNTPMREFANSYLQEGYDKSIVETNTEHGVEQVGREGQSVYSGAISRINDSASRWSSKIHPINAGLQIGSSFASAYNTYGRTQKR